MPGSFSSPNAATLGKRKHGKDPSCEAEETGGSLAEAVTGLDACLGDCPPGLGYPEEIWMSWYPWTEVGHRGVGVVGGVGNWATVPRQARQYYS